MFKTRIAKLVERCEEIDQEYFCWCGGKQIICLVCGELACIECKGAIEADSICWDCK